jgi:hypothetical protein
MLALSTMLRVVSIPPSIPDNRCSVLGSCGSPATLCGFSLRWHLSSLIAKGKARSLRRQRLGAERLGANVAVQTSVFV